MTPPTKQFFTIPSGRDMTTFDITRRAGGLITNCNRPPALYVGATCLAHTKYSAEKGHCALPFSTLYPHPRKEATAAVTHTSG